MPSQSSSFDKREWPALPLQEWKATRETLHRYLQVIGKVKLSLAPMMNHWWQVGLMTTVRGLTTGPIPVHGVESFSIEVDFVRHELLVSTSWGKQQMLSLGPRPVAEFFRAVMGALNELGIEARVTEIPQEIAGELVPFSEDEQHASYDKDQVGRWWRIIQRTEPLMDMFRAPFTGKASPVLFWWGSFDLAVTLFSGRVLPRREDAGAMERESYSEECFSVGFWPGAEGVCDAAFYAHAVPQPEGFMSAPVRPAGAYYEKTYSEFLLPYDIVRKTSAPDEAILQFMKSSYDAVVALGHWDRSHVERALLAHPPRPRPSAKGQR